MGAKNFNFVPKFFENGF